jgi:predicted PurR-regulated permease PerM
MQENSSGMSSGSDEDNPTGPNNRSNHHNGGNGTDRLVLLQRQLTVVVLALLAIFLIFQVGSYFSEIIRILGYSILLFYIFINTVDWLEKPLRNRAMAILIVYLGLLAITIFGAIVIFPALIWQVTQLISSLFSQLPQMLQEFIKTLAPMEASFHAVSIRIKAVDILTSIATTLPKPDPGIVIGRVTDAAMSTMTWLVYGLSTVVVSFYFLLDGRNIKERIIQMFPKKYFLPLTILTTDIDLSLQMFFRGQIVLGLLFGLFMVAVFLGMGVHYALLLGAFLGVCEIIPVIGPAIGFIPIVLTVAFDGLDNVALNRFGQVIVVFLVLNLVQWLKDNVIAPKYIGNVIGLHPVMIFVAIMIGAKLDGLSGIICSLPVACVVNVLVSHLASQFGPSRSVLQEASDSYENSSGNGNSQDGSSLGHIPKKSIDAAPEPHSLQNSNFSTDNQQQVDIVEQIKGRANITDL